MVVRTASLSPDIPHPIYISVYKYIFPLVVCCNKVTSLAWISAKTHTSYPHAVCELFHLLVWYLLIFIALFILYQYATFRYYYYW